MINEEGEVEKNFTNGFVGTEEENKFVREYCFFNLFSDFLINSYFIFPDNKYRN